MKRNLVIALVVFLVMAVWFSYAASGKMSYQAATVAGVSEPYGRNSQASAMAPAVAAPVAITADDLASAGFASPVVQPPTEDGSYQLASYFWVNGKKSVDGLSSSSVRDLVMVSVVPVPSGGKTLFDYGAFYNSTSTPFAIDGGTGREFSGLSQGRTVINFIKNDWYVVVIGPDIQKTEALARIAAGKI